MPTAAEQFMPELIRTLRSYAPTVTADTDAQGRESSIPDPARQPLESAVHMPQPARPAWRTVRIALVRGGRDHRLPVCRRSRRYHTGGTERRDDLRIAVPERGRAERPSPIGMAKGVPDFSCRRRGRRTCRSAGTPADTGHNQGSAVRNLYRHI